MTKKLFTVTIGIPAHNEERNIKNLLRAAVSQKEKHIRITSIIVVSDGSTDRTVQSARSVKGKNITVVAHHTRLGKPSRVNELLQTTHTDALVIIDADTVLNDHWTIERLIDTLRKNPKVGMVCGNGQPMGAKTFLEQAINNYRHAQSAVRPWFDFGKTAYCTHGFLAYRKTFAQSLSLPHDVLNDDTFSFFACIANGWKARYAPKAIVWYRSPQTIQDHVRQSTRHLAGGKQMLHYFPARLIKKFYHVPKKILILILLYQLLKHPIGYLCLKVLNTYCEMQSNNYVKRVNIKWASVYSSKIVS